MRGDAAARLGRIVGESRGRVNRCEVRLQPHRAMTPPAPRFSAAALTAFAHALLVQAGVRDDIATDVADILVEADLLGHTTHGLALLAPYLKEIEQGTMAKSGVAGSRQRTGRRADLGRVSAAGPVAHAARARRGGRDGGCTWHRHGRRSPLAPHRVPRRVPHSRDRARARRAGAELRSAARGRRSARGRHADRHPQSDRRGTADVGRPRPRRRFDVDHQHGLREPGARGGSPAPRPVARRLRRQRDRRSAGARERPQGRAVAVGRPRRRLQGLRTRAHRRSADGGARRLRAAPIRRKAGAAPSSSRCSIPKHSAGSRRSGGRWIIWCAPHTPRDRVPAPIACACRAKRGSSAGASSVRTASRSTPRSCRRSNLGG